MRTRDAIAQELATEEAKLTELERGRSTTRARIDALRAELQLRPSPNLRRFLSSAKIQCHTRPAGHEVPCEHYGMMGGRSGFWGS
jgi:hypothetical protein